MKEETPPIESQEKKKKLILIADDNPNILSGLAMFFEDDYRIETAQDGLELVGKFKKETPDLVISDNDMGPGLTGTDVLKIIKKEDPNAKIIIFSGDNIEKKVTELGAVYV